MFKILDQIDRVVERSASFLLIVVVSSLFLLSLFSIISRWAEFSPLWIEPFVRHLVFLSAFLAGITISGSGKHISIDIIDKYLERFLRWRLLLKRSVLLISSVSLSWFVYSGFLFLKSEIEFGRVEFLKIHSSVWVAIIPIGFAIMALRFFLHFMRTFGGKKW